MCYIGGMNAIGENWNCPDCGRHMTPHGDCVKCAKEEKARQIAAGEIKRAKDIKVGDVFVTRFSFKIDAITAHTVEITAKGRVHINKGMGSTRGEDIFQGDQWVDICQNCATLSA